MNRAVSVLLRLLIAIVVALALLTLERWIFSASFSGAIAEAPHRLFLFMDIGLGVWLLLLIVGAVRQRGIGWGVRGVIAAAVIGAVLNLLTVIAVGFVQQGGWATLFMLYAVEAGLAFIVGAVVAAFIVRPRP